MSEDCEIMLYGAIDDYDPQAISAKQVVSQIRGNKDAKQITLRIASPGGSVIAGFQIFDALRNSGKRVVAYIDGMSGSIASVIMLAAQEIRASENSTVFIHNPYATVTGDASQLRKMANEVERYGARIIKAYKDRTKLSEAKIRELMDAETYLSAEDAKDYGFVDFIDAPSTVMACAPLQPEELRAILLKGADMSDNVETLPDTKSVQAIQNAERKRVSEIYSKVANAGLDASFASALVESGADMNTVNAKIVDQYAKVNASATGPEILNAYDHNSRTLDNPEFRASAVEDAIVAKMSGVAPTGAAKEFSNLPIKALGAALSGKRGGFLDARNDATGFLTTSDWGSVLSNALNKRLNQMMTAAPIGVAEVAKDIAVPDFRDNTLHQLSTFPSLLKVREAGEIEHGVFTSDYQKVSVETFARAVSVSYQSLVNDDLQALETHIRSIAMAVTELRSKTLLNAFSAQLSDNNPIFHTSRKNSIPTTALDVSAIAAARLALRKQAAIGSTEPMGLDGRTLLVGPDREADAWRLIQTLYPNQTSSINPYQALLKVVVEPRMSKDFAYLFCDNTAYPSLMFATLASQPQPTFEVEKEFNTLGTSYRCFWSVGAGWADWRGVIRIPLN